MAKAEGLKDGYRLGEWFLSFGLLPYESPFLKVIFRP